MCAWHNDLHSLPKELARESEVFNLVFVLQKEYNISLEEAVKRLVKEHDECITEYVELENSPPDFGVHQKM